MKRLDPSPGPGWPLNKSRRLFLRLHAPTKHLAARERACGASVSADSPVQKNCTTSYVYCTTNARARVLLPRARHDALAGCAKASSRSYRRTTLRARRILPVDRCSTRHRAVMIISQSSSGVSISPDSVLKPEPIGGFRTALSPCDHMPPAEDAIDTSESGSSREGALADDQAGVRTDRDCPTDRDVKEG